MTLDRRGFLAACSSAGIASPLLPGILYTLAVQAQEPSDNIDQSKPPKITPEMIDAAASLAGITITPDQKAMMLDGLNEQRSGYSAIRKLHLPNDVPPAYIFDPLPPGAKINTEKQEPVYSNAIVSLPKKLDHLAFATIPAAAQLAAQ